MPIDLRQVATDVALFTLDFNGQTMPVSYRPSVMTGRYMTKLSLGLTPEDAAKALAEVVVSWDIIGLDGEPVPIDNADAILDNVPGNLIQAIFTGIQKDAQDPSGKASTTSNAG